MNKGLSDMQGGNNTITILNVTDDQGNSLDIDQVLLSNQPSYGKENYVYDLEEIGFEWD